MGFGPATTSEMIRSRRGSSSIPYLYMGGMMRALNLPNNKNVLYVNGKWVNIDNHFSYGMDVPSTPIQGYPYTAPPPAESVYFPETNQLFIQKIKTFISQSAPLPSSTTIALFVNIGDVKTYGPQYIVEKASAGGFNALIVTLKPTWGGLYFSTTDSEFVEDVLTPFLTEARKENIKVYAALSVLADFNSIYINPSWKSKYTGDPGIYYVSPDFPYPQDAVSPCISQYKQRMKNLISDLTGNYFIDGIVFSNIGLHESYDNNPACSIYKIGSNWKTKLITNYATELVQDAKQKCPGCDVRILSAPMWITSGSPWDLYINNWTRLRNQNFTAMSSLGNGLIVPLVENGWLDESEYLFPTVAQDLKTKTGITPGISFYFTDEWEYTPEFYNGVVQYADSKGINFVSFHAANSLEGEYAYAYNVPLYAPAFTKAQYLKISQVSGVQNTCISSGAEICDGKDNDCNGQIDDGVTKVCGSSIGVCETGTERCVNGAWTGICEGEIETIASICTQSTDNNCDNIQDTANCACLLSNARWSINNINEGTSVDLLYNYNNCQAFQRFDIKIFRNQGISSIFQKTAIPAFEGILSWNPPFAFECDNNGICKSVEYQFTVQRYYDSLSSINSGYLKVKSNCDSDGDLYLKQSCIPTDEGYDTSVYDCNDNDPNIYPGQGCAVCIPQTEICDGFDNDCDTIIDDGGNLDCSGGAPYCSTGRCVQCTTNVQCNDNNLCTDDYCNSGVCTNVNDNTNLCSDNLYCNGAESCSAGICIITPLILTDGKSCTDDSCDETNDRIVHTNNNNFCLNGLFCDGAEICDPSSSSSNLITGCRAGTPIVCDDGIACTVDDCFEGIDEGTDNLGQCVAYTNTCTACGNGIIRAGETCDDSNIINGDGCSAACQIENGWSCTGEPSSCLRCTLTDAQWSGTSTTQGQNVQLTVTGNSCSGKVLDFSVWEDDTVDADDPASINPTAVTFVGSNAVGTWTAEWQCDGDLGGVCTFGNPEYYFNAILREDNRVNITSLGRANGILVTQASSPTCGNNITQSGEQCDDGNSIDTDSCTNACTTPICGDTIVRSGVEQCDAGSTGNSQCTVSCTLTRCGDSIVQSPNGNNANEICDSNSQACSDNGYAGIASCSGTCLNYASCAAVERCGDGVIQALAGETCDDSNTNNGDGCNALCRIEILGSPPDIQIISPETKEYKNVPIRLEFVSSSADECWILLDGVRQDKTCNIMETINLRSSVLNIAENHRMEFFAKNIYGEAVKSVDFSIIFTRLISIKYNKFSGVGETTNLDNLEDNELENLSLTLDDGLNGKIKFIDLVNITQDANETTNETNIDDNVYISDKRIEVNSANLRSLNKKAQLTFRNVNFNQPKMKRDGADCSDCAVESYTSNILIVNVTGFSIYTVEEGQVQQPPPVNNDGGSTGGNNGGSSSGSDVPIKSKPKEDNRTVNISVQNPEGEELDKVELLSANEEAQSVNVTSGTRIVVEVEGSNIGHAVDFVIEDGRLKIRIVGEAETYDLENDDVIPLRFGDKEVYFGVSKLGTSTALVTLGLDEEQVRAKIRASITNIANYISIIIIILLAVIIILLFFKFKKLRDKF